MWGMEADVDSFSSKTIFFDNPHDEFLLVLDKSKIIEKESLGCETRVWRDQQLSCGDAVRPCSTTL